MRLKQTVLLLLITVSSMPASVPAAETSASAAASVSEAATSPISSIKQAKELIRRGKYLEAQGIYEEILKDSSRASAELETLRHEYEDLNLKLVFSRTQTPDSTFHNVAPGESLYKIALKYMTTVDLIKKSNGLKGDKIRPDMKLKVITGTFLIRISKSDNTMVLLLNDKPIKRYRVATGTDGGTPTGEFTIINKLENPTWYKTGAVVPPESPENSLGTRWLGFDHPGYGIHGTKEPESIGTQSTSGCIRMLNEEVQGLYAMVPVGTKVIITD